MTGNDRLHEDGGHAGFQQGDWKLMVADKDMRVNANHATVVNSRWGFSSKVKAYQGKCCRAARGRRYARRRCGRQCGRRRCDGYRLRVRRNTSSAHLGFVLCDRGAAPSQRLVLWKEGARRGVVARRWDQTFQLRAHGLNAARGPLDGVDELGRHLHRATHARASEEATCRAELSRARAGGGTVPADRPP